MQFSRCPIPIHHHHFRVHSVVVRILLLVILALESVIFRHRIMSVRISVRFRWPQVRSVVIVVVVLSEDGKFRDRFWKSVWKTKTGRFLKYKWGWFRLGFVTRGQRVFPIVLLSEIFFEIFARIGILRCLVSNDEIESCLGWTIVRVLTSVMTVDWSEKREMGHIKCEQEGPRWGGETERLALWEGIQRVRQTEVDDVKIKRRVTEVDSKRYKVMKKIKSQGHKICTKTAQNIASNYHFVGSVYLFDTSSSPTLVMERSSCQRCSPKTPELLLLLLAFSLIGSLVAKGEPASREAIKSTSNWNKNFFCQDLIFRWV